MILNSFKKLVKTVNQDFYLKLLVAVLFLTFIARLPTLYEPFWYGDEGVYYFVSNGINNGLSLYKDVFEISFPLKYYLLALVIKVLGLSIWSARFFLSYWVLATQIGIFLLGRKLFAPKIGLLTAIFYGVLTAIPFIEGNISNNEILQNLPVVFGILALVHKRYSLSGLLLSISFLIKFPGIFDLGVILFFILFSEGLAIKNLTKLWLRVLIPFLAPVVMMFLYYLSIGQFGYFYEANFGRNTGYVAYANSFFFQYDLLLLKLLVLGVACLYLLKNASLLTKKYGLEVLLLVIWFMFDIFAAAFSGRSYTHYLLQPLLPLCFILTLLILRKESRKFLLIVAILGFAFVYIFGFRNFWKKVNYALFDYYPNFFGYISGAKSLEDYNLNFDAKMNRNLVLSKMIQDRTDKTDRIFVWANEPQLYALSDRLGATRFGVAYHVLESEKFKEEVLNNLYEIMPKIIVVEHNFKTLPGLENLLSSHYNLTSVVEGASLYEVSKN